MAPLEWKTDWQPIDNHARNGARDIVRLLGNYELLKQELNTVFGFDIQFSTPPTNGYATYPFADFLNNLEACLNELHVWGGYWIEKIIIWRATGSGPTYEDINRWETNGYWVEQFNKSARSIFLRCGVPYSNSYFYFVN